MAMMRLLLVLMISIPGVAYAAPSITGSGGTAHGSTLTVTGSGFGAKSPAAPLWWDDGEGSSDGSAVPKYGDAGCTSNSWVTSATLSGANKCYNDALPRLITQSSGVGNLKYRAGPYRNVAVPHSRSSKFITGAHDDEGECASGNEPGQDVGVTIGDTSRHDIWYVHYYIRLDPLWPINNPQNYKFFDVTTNDPTTRPSMYSNSVGATYIAAGPCTCGTDPLNRLAPGCGESYWNGVMADMLVLDLTTCPVGGSPTCYGDLIVKDTNKPNPIYQWTREEWQVNYVTSKLKFSVNNALMIDTTRVESCVFNSTRIPAAISGFTVGGFWKEDDCNGQDDLNDDAWRYFDDIYVDSTWSRVMLCNNATYASATICEPQPPTEWADGSITVTANLGALTGSTAWAFVFDSTNVANDVGYPVQFGVTTSSGITSRGVSIR